MTAPRTIAFGLRAALWVAKWSLVAALLYVSWEAALGALVAILFVEAIPRGPYAKMES